MADSKREMTLEEWVHRLPVIHRARREYEEMKREIDEAHARGNRMIDGFKRFWYRATKPTDG